jgi:hypothetical protein
MTTLDELHDFARLVQAMRAKQNDYFRKGRLTADLTAARDLEREVDRSAREILQGPTLFDEGRAC